MTTSTLTDALSLDAPIADILDRAADLIAQNGRHVGAYWEFAHRIAWQPTMECCAAGAIGVAMGLRSHADVDWFVVPAVIDGGDEPPHPAFAALMRHLGFDAINDVFAWSDEHQPGEIARVMRECAKQLRTAGVAA